MRYSDCPKRGVINSVWKVRDNSREKKVKIKGHLQIHQVYGRAKDFAETEKFEVVWPAWGPIR